MSSCGIVCGTGDWSGPLPGDPDNNISLHATPVFGGIEVSWTYPSTNAHAVAHVLLFRGSSSDRASAVQTAVVAGSKYFDRIEEEVLYFYWIRVVSINGTTGDWVGPVSATAKTRRAGTIEDLSGEIGRGLLAIALRQDIDQITLNYQDLLAEIQNRVAGDTALSLALSELQDGVTQAVAFVQEEINTRIDGDNALAQQVGVIAALNASNASAIINEATARVSADEALTTQVNALFAASGDDAAAAVLAESIARTDADSALASQITTAQSTLGSQIASVQTTLQTNINDLDGVVGAMYTARVSVNGLVGGFGLYNNGSMVEAGFEVDRFWIGRTGQDKVLPFIVDNDTVYINKARIKNADIDTLKLSGQAVIVPSASTWSAVYGQGQVFDLPFTVTGLAPGEYVLLHGHIGAVATAAQGRIIVTVNGTQVADDQIPTGSRSYIGIHAAVTNGPNVMQVLLSEWPTQQTRISMLGQVVKR